MRIGSCKSSPGKLVRGTLPLTTYRNKEIKIPLLLAEGTQEGPTIMVSAGIHGNEINGIEILRRFAKQLDPKELSGTLIIIPVLNVHGFLQRMRYVPFDGQDFNRAFEPTRKGSVSQRMASTFMMEVVARCDFGIDLHDAGEDNILLPHSRVHKEEEDGCTHELGATFGTEVVMERTGAKGMIAVQAHRQHRVPILTVEIGGGMVIREDFVPVGLRGIKNMLISKGAMRGVVDIPRHQFFLSRREGYLSPMDGILQLSKGLGDTVNTGERLGNIVNPATAEEDEINAYRSGIVLSVRQQAVIKKGETAISLLHMHGEGEAVLPVDETAHMVVNKEGNGRTLRPCSIYEKACSLR